MRKIDVAVLKGIDYDRLRISIGTALLEGSSKDLDHNYALKSVFKYIASYLDRQHIAIIFHIAH